MYFPISSYCLLKFSLFLLPHGSFLTQGLRNKPQSLSDTITTNTIASVMFTIIWPRPIIKITVPISLSCLIHLLQHHPVGIPDILDYECFLALYNSLWPKAAGFSMSLSLELVLLAGRVKSPFRGENIWPAVLRAMFLVNNLMHG